MVWPDRSCPACGADRDNPRAIDAMSRHTEGRERFTEACLHAALSYDRRTGVFRWKIVPKYRGGRIKVGDEAGYVAPNGYRRIKLLGRYYLAHRLAWFYVHGSWPSRIDHRDQCRDHNWVSNLRLATHRQNMQNTKGRNSIAGLKGVSANGRGYRARIKNNKMERHLGTFSTPEEAHAVYVRTAKEVFGEFASDGKPISSIPSDPGEVPLP